MSEYEEVGAKSETGFWLFREEVRLATLYLVAIVGAEVVTNLFSLVGGVISHAILLTALIVHSSLAAESSSRKLLLALCLAPLTRIMSLSLPLAQFSPIYW